MNRDEVIAEIKAQLMAELDSFKEQIQTQISPETRAKITQSKDQVEDFVKENPWASMAIAAGMGFLLGRLFYRSGDES